MISLKKIFLCSALCFQVAQSSYQTGPFGTKYCFSDSDSDADESHKELLHKNAVELPVVVGTRQTTVNQLTLIRSYVAIVVGSGLFLYLIPCSSGYSPFNCEQ